ncbi:hypothetical protein JZ751_024384 [Albula glossodonta]|uniref:Uncharacterized protein n=1 Tax=Albula glossodonta TaxID=121402 RepID=A0A8T2NGY5_9TELE|nr:hypothetical protein JZ751_024384 [Albula glossodonta]
MQNQLLSPGLIETERPTFLRLKSEAKGGQASRSVAPSPIITTFSRPYCSFSMLITLPLPPDSATWWSGMLSCEATCSTMQRKPPEMRNTFTFRCCRLATSSLATQMGQEREITGLLWHEHNGFSVSCTDY